MTITSPNARPFSLVSETLYRHFRARWFAIDREWRSGFTQDSIGVWYCIKAARDDLTAEIRALAPNFPGSYLIPT